MHCLPQRLKSTFFEKKNTSLLGATPFEKIPKIIEFIAQCRIAAASLNCTCFRIFAYYVISFNVSTILGEIVNF